jgi:hypothetical protein
MLAPYTFVFVSHVSEDRSAATALVAELEGRGIPCWVAPRNVNPGRPFDVEIAEAIETCRGMLLVFSERCNESDYIRREVTVAGDVGKVIIPYRIEDARPKGGLRVRLSDLHWIDAFDHPERALEALVRTLRPAGELFAPPDSKETASYSPLIAVEGTNTTAADSASGQDAVARPSPTSLTASENSTKTATRAAASTLTQHATAQPSPSLASKVLQWLNQPPVRYAVGVVVWVIAGFTTVGFYGSVPVGAPPALVSAEKYEADLLRALSIPAIRPDATVVAASPPPPAPPPSRRSNLAAIIKSITQDDHPPAVAAPPPGGPPSPVALEIMKEMGPAREGFRIPPPTGTEGAAPNEVPLNYPRDVRVIKFRPDPKKPSPRNWMIQVGAYQSEADANQRLINVRNKASEVLAEADAFTDKIDKAGTPFYRARFRNLEQSSAESACKTLKLESIECVAIKN